MDCMVTEMGPYLEYLTTNSTTSHLLPSNPELLTKLQDLNKAELVKLDAQLEDAVKNFGNVEVSDALRAKALYLAKIGEKVSREHNSSA